MPIPHYKKGVNFTIQKILQIQKGAFDSRFEIHTYITNTTSNNALNIMNQTAMIAQQK